MVPASAAVKGCGCRGWNPAIRHNRPLIQANSLRAPFITYILIESHHSISYLLPENAKSAENPEVRRAAERVPGPLPSGFRIVSAAAVRYSRQSTGNFTKSIA